MYCFGPLLRFCGLLAWRLELTNPQKSEFARCGIKGRRSTPKTQPTNFRDRCPQRLVEVVVVARPGFVGASPPSPLPLPFLLLPY